MLPDTDFVYPVFSEDPCGCKGAEGLILPETVLGSGEAILETDSRERRLNRRRLEEAEDGDEESI